MPDESRPDTTDHALVSYRDGDALVICDPGDPRAWIRSDLSTTLGESATDATRIRSA